MTDPIVRVRDLSLSGIAKPRLDTVSLDLLPGETVGVIGPNGAGKSSLLAALAGVEAAWTGSIVVSNKDVRNWEPVALSRQISYLPQDFRCQWALTVENLVELGATRGQGFGSAFGWAAATSARDTNWVYDAFELTALRHRLFHRLSGGEQARAALAMAIVAQPTVLLADEPIANLDPYHQLEAMQRLKSLAAGGMAVLIALHDLTLAARFCDRLLLLNDGRVAATGAPMDVLRVDRLSEIYRIDALIGRHAGEPYVLPWTRV